VSAATFVKTRLRRTPSAITARSPDEIHSMDRLGSRPVTLNEGGSGCGAPVSIEAAACDVHDRANASSTCSGQVGAHGLPIPSRLEPDDCRRPADEFFMDQREHLCDRSVL